jgi:hypothetical protein
MSNQLTHSSSIDNSDAVFRTLEKLREWKILYLKSPEDWKAWEAGLSDLSLEELRHGLRNVRTHKGWFDLKAFYTLCKSVNTFPSVDDAWDEANQAIGKSHHWSHPVVWRAQQRTGYFAMKTMRGDAVETVKRRFAKHYNDSCQLFTVEPFDCPRALQITQQEPEFNEQVNREGLAKARAVFR